MCRIAWFWDYWNIDYDTDTTLLAMRDSLAYWGPDSAWVYHDISSHVSLWHRRLAIIDLSPNGHQPMISGKHVITFNGEIYNYQEIHDELAELWVDFSSRSDTEVLLKWFIHWWVDIFEKCRGMFAAALWDWSKQELTVVRDRPGIKPLYYYFDGEIFMFASEIKALIQHPKFKKQINKHALQQFLQYWTISWTESIFENVHKVSPWSYVQITKDKSPSQTSYRSIDSFLQLPKVSIDFEQAKEELYQKLLTSVSYRLISDVPVWVFLSWGTDSSLVTMLAQEVSTSPIKTFTIWFAESAYNEAWFARQTADILWTDHHEFTCTALDALQVVTQFPELYDEPFADSSWIPTLLLSQLTREHVTVALSWDAWDEFFYGYPRYKLTEHTIANLSRPPFKEFIKFLPARFAKCFSRNHWYAFDARKKLQYIVNSDGALPQKYDLVNSYFLPDEINALVVDPVPATDTIPSAPLWDLESKDLLFRRDFHRYLPDYVLTKVDRATMRVALEAREPLLDHVVMEYAAQLPYAYKYHRGQQKYILKSLLAKHLPHELIHRKKQWFSVPLKQWLCWELQPLVKELLSEEALARSWLFQVDVLSKLIQQFYDGRGIHPHKIWVLLCFQMRWQKYMR